MKMRYWALTMLCLLATLLITKGSAQQCGSQAGGALCPGGLCCSEHGWCGTTDAYCGPGCQSQCSPTPGQCGSQAGGALCPGGLCCSEHGWCGTTYAYCGPGCQSQCSPTPGQCGSQAGGALCAGGLCCSEHGWCGTTYAYCGPGCQSQCSPTPPPPPPPPPTPPPPAAPSPPSSGDITDLISSSMFDVMFPNRNYFQCLSQDFYTYDAFITAAKSFPTFATTGDTDTRKRELAAFFGQTSQETTGGWEGAPGGLFLWGYCFVKEQQPASDYCDQGSQTQWPCAPGKRYYGRGPIQLSYNYNYGQAGEALGLDLLNNPDLVEIDPVISFKTALWFWMTTQLPKPSCHDVIIGNWTPTLADEVARRVPGYGVITNIINGGVECGRGPDPRVEGRIGFYKRYCSDEIFDVSTGDNLDCNNQVPFGFGLLLDSM
uniref:Chitinase n=1 Tax=Camellia fraterna TaxID=542725 RepID=A0A2I6RLI5_9ERIC|nr:chitinase [Camellia fraterna]